jgi:formylglycine-generating enzyme required for sulfatase activity
LRGGSWLYNRVNARAASRGFFSPGFRYDGVGGFRLVVRCPPSK